MTNKVGNIIEQTDLGKRINTKTFMKFKLNCEKCPKPLLSYEEQREGLCSDCLAPILKARQEERLKEIKSKIKELLERRGVPKRYSDCTLDNFQIVGEERKRVLGQVKQYIKRMGTTDEGLFLTGSNGTGKTHLAVAVMREFLLSDHLDCHFIKVPELLLNIREHIGKGWSEKEIIEEYKGYGCLFLDELGVEKASEWALQDLYLILDGRSGALKPTIITSNLGLEEIGEHIGLRFLSRIVEMCKSIVMEFQDWRLLTRKEKVESAK